MFFVVKYIKEDILIYIGKRKNKRWSIQEKNQIVLLYLDQHMYATQIVKEFKIPQSKLLYSWVAQYRKFGTCVDNRGVCIKLQNPKKGRQKGSGKPKYQDMTKEQLIKELKLRDELKNFLVYLNQQNKNS